MTEQEQFFYDNAGFSYDPKCETSEQGRERCAKDLAAAESYARELDWSFEWQMESENPVDVLGEPDEVNGPFYDPTNDFSVCLLWGSQDTPEILQSLGMIEESKNTRERMNYRRVVEAELASEAMCEYLKTA